MPDDRAVPAAEVGGLELQFDSLITIRYDDAEQRPVFDLGDVDPYAAVTILRMVAETVEGWLALPRDINADPDEEDEEED